MTPGCSSPSSRSGIFNEAYKRSLHTLSKRLIGPPGAHGVKPRPPGGVLGNPLPGVRSILDLGQDSVHLTDGLFIDNALPGGVISVLSRVTHRVAHVVQSTAVDQVDDQLEFVNALEIGDLGLIAGLNQCLKSGFDQCADTTAQDGLLPEEVGLGFLGKGRLDNAGPGRPERLGIGQSRSAGGSAGILMDRQKRRSALAVSEGLPNAR